MLSDLLLCTWLVSQPIMPILRGHPRRSQDSLHLRRARLGDRPASKGEFAQDRARPHSVEPPGRFTELWHDRRSDDEETEQHCGIS